MTRIVLSANAKLGSIASFHGKFVVTAKYGLAFIARNELEELTGHAYQLLFGNDKNLEIVPWPFKDAADKEFAVEVTHDRIEIQAADSGDLIQIHQANAGDFLITSEGRVLVGSHQSGSFPKFIDIDTGIARKASNDYALKLSGWELVAFKGSAEVLRIKAPKNNFFTS